MSDLTFFRHLFQELGISWHRIGVCPVPEKSLVRYTDPCHCIYYLVRHDRGIFCAGPYCNAPVTMSQIHALCAAFSLPKQAAEDLVSYFDALPVIGEDDVLEAVLAAVCDELFGEAGWASVTLDDSERETFPISSSSYEREISRAELARIEKRYEEENRMLALVSSGDVEGIRTLLQGLGGDPASAMEVRSADSLRNRKNYLVIANTLLRKAAEEGSVHPYYLDRLSSGFARQIEGARSAAACEALLPEMIRRYTQLVRQKRDAGHSPLVRRVLLEVDRDLSQDLSLKALAGALYVTPQYLSGLFRRETGQTLTEYVTGQRIRHALLLLSTTRMPVQQIAAYCGFPDAGYFTRIFKSRIGLPPEQYRKKLRGE
ncbi:MAG: AraC family transcriptional regulator [Lachnospiraceae bacterium]|nr:AraC family transcriptional regulator [Lachnospiraceae bacterium]